MEFKERLTVDLGHHLFTGTAASKLSPVEGLQERPNQLRVLIVAKNGAEAMDLLHSWLIAEGQDPKQCSLGIIREIPIAANDDPPTR